MFKIPKDKSIQVLNIGTKILLKDVMDTYLRSLGEVKTYYAHKLSTAIEAYKEKRPKIIFCEQGFPEGSALDFIHAIGGLEPSGDHYFVLAAEEASGDLVSLAVEMGMDEVLVKPFATEDIQKIVERYFEKSSFGDQDWVKDLRVARLSFHEKRFQEAEELFVMTARKYPGNANVQIECVEFFIGRNLLQPAHSILDGLIKASPENTRTLQLMGTTLKKMGRFKEASEFFLKASSLSPLNSLRQVELAETYLQMAEEQIQAALKIENEHPGLMLTKARFQLVRKDYAALVSYLDVKRSFLPDAAKKEADTIAAIAKKLGGIK